MDRVLAPEIFYPASILFVTIYVATRSDQRTMVAWWKLSLVGVLLLSIGIYLLLEFGDSPASIRDILLFRGGNGYRYFVAMGFNCLSAGIALLLRRKIISVRRAGSPPRKRDDGHDPFSPPPRRATRR